MRVLWIDWMKASGSTTLSNLVWARKLKTKKKKKTKDK